METIEDQEFRIDRPRQLTIGEKNSITYISTHVIKVQYAKFNQL